MAELDYCLVSAGEPGNGMLRGLDVRIKLKDAKEALINSMNQGRVRRAHRKEVASCWFMVRMAHPTDYGQF